MSDKKENKTPTFSIPSGDYKGKYEITAPVFHVPNIGIVKAAELLKMPELLAELVEINSGAVQKID
jgi:hypothetical protein